MKIRIGTAICFIALLLLIGLVALFTYTEYATAQEAEAASWPTGEIYNEIVSKFSSDTYNAMDAVAANITQPELDAIVKALFPEPPDEEKKTKLMYFRGSMLDVFGYKEGDSIMIAIDTECERLQERIDTDTPLLPAEPVIIE